jgi:hypothetical protein
MYFAVCLVCQKIIISKDKRQELCCEQERKPFHYFTIEDGKVVVPQEYLV